ncbi:MAG: hypothetical protein ACKVIK_05470 [Rhodospirillales bacterium]
MEKFFLNAGLGKPMPLNEKTIIKEVDNSTDWSSASVFVLGGVRKGADGTPRFQIRRVSHVDGDLGIALRSHIGKFTGFRFKFFRSTHNAYDRECQIYHDFKPRENKEHPNRPKNTKFTCPVAKCDEAG